MSRYRSYLEVSKQVISDYHGEEPFSIYLRKFFSQKKKFGSTDRKTIAALCYSYFRAGHALSGELEKKIVQAFFLCSGSGHHFLEAIDKELNAECERPLVDKLQLLQVKPHDLFPFRHHLSPEIDSDDFFLSHLHQPRLFLRLRTGKKQHVIQKLQAAGASFISAGDSALSLPNGTKLDGVIAVNREAVVQDLSSQQTLDFLNAGVFEKLPVDVWDCCAASGGKSILAFDKLQGKMRLTVTDIRPGVLKNLKGRLGEAGVPVYRSQLADLEKPVNDIGTFQLIICDAPCTGSGTWSRVPEQLHFFKAESISRYVQLQKKIILNSIAQLQSGGIFVYITCSVFAEENEEQVEFITQQPGMTLLHQQYIKGYNGGADTLFSSAFRLSF